MQRFRPNSTITAGFLFAIGSAALFAIRPIFVKLVYLEGVSPLTLICLRMAFSVPVYIVILALLLREKRNRERLNPKLILQISIAGVFGYYAASFLDLMGLQYVTAQLGRMILYSYPTFVVLLAALFLSQKIHGRTLISLLITYSGIALIFGHELHLLGGDVITGGLYITAGAVTFAVYLVFGKSLIDKVGSPVFTCIALIAASTAIFIHYGISSRLTMPEVNQTAFNLIVIIALFCTIIPTFFTTAAMARIGADKTGIVSMIGPAFTSVFAVAVLSEAFTVFHLLGIGLSIIGIYILHQR